MDRRMDGWIPNHNHTLDLGRLVVTLTYIHTCIHFYIHTSNQPSLSFPDPMNQTGLVRGQAVCLAYIGTGGPNLNKLHAVLAVLLGIFSGVGN